jgi:hypothetical protein
VWHAVVADVVETGVWHELRDAVFPKWHCNYLLSLEYFVEEKGPKSGLKTD